MTGSKKRQVTSNKVNQKCSIVNLANDSEALREAGVALTQKLARQKRKPKRLTENGPTQEMSPRAGQVNEMQPWRTRSIIPLTLYYTELITLEDFNM